MSDVLSREDFATVMVQLDNWVDRDGSHLLDQMEAHDAALRAERDRFETLLNESQALLATAREERDNRPDDDEWSRLEENYIAERNLRLEAEARAERAETRCEELGKSREEAQVERDSAMHQKVRAEAALERVTAALRKYGTHRTNEKGRGCNRAEPECDCGLNALAALPPGAKESEGSGA